MKRLIDILPVKRDRLKLNYAKRIFEAQWIRITDKTTGETVLNWRKQDGDGNHN